MSFQGRSLDDMPLAAYTTGAVPDDEDVEATPDPGYTSVPAASSSTADRIAAAHVAEAAPADVPAGGRKRGLKLRLPKLGRTKALAADAPFQPVAAQAAAPAGAMALPPMPQVPPRAAAESHPQSTFQAVRADLAPAPGPAAKSRTAQAGVRPALPGVPALRAPGVLAGAPGDLVRDPRVLAGGVVVIGLALLAFSLLGGGGPASGSGGPNSSQDTGVVAPTPPPGNASVELKAGGAGSFTLLSATGAGPAVNSQIDASWTDATGASLTITGLASQGVRTTDANFVLTWTMLVDGAPVTFASQARECTIGMAVGVTSIHGTFTCKKLASVDGKHTIDLAGSYTT